ncbi:hypothetical protein MKK88_13410, partial [Methylobacterium sp. E-005]|nr:hypothetical protein [Methylobacterium sp. E-005]
MAEHASPCRHLAPGKRKAVGENALAFNDQQGPEGHRLGWTAHELFGVHPTSGTLRVDSCGAVLVDKRQRILAHRLPLH